MEITPSVRWDYSPRRYALVAITLGPLDTQRVRGTAKTHAIDVPSRRADLGVIVSGR